MTIPSNARTSSVVYENPDDEIYENSDDVVTDFFEEGGGADALTGGGVYENAPKYGSYSGNAARGAVYHTSNGPNTGVVYQTDDQLYPPRVVYQGEQSGVVYQGGAGVIYRGGQPGVYQGDGMAPQPPAGRQRSSGGGRPPAPRPAAPPTPPRPQKAHNSVAIGACGNVRDLR